MTYDDAFERSIRKSSTICPECGCYISWLTEYTCPACEWSEKKNGDDGCDAYSLANKLQHMAASGVCTTNELIGCYKSLGGNAEVDLIIRKISEFATNNGIEFTHIYSPIEKRYVFDFAYAYQGRSFNYRQSFTRDELLYHEHRYGYSSNNRIVDRLKSYAVESIKSEVAKPYVVRANHAEIMDMELSPGTIAYAYDTKELYTCNSNGIVLKIATNVEDRYTDYTACYKKSSLDDISMLNSDVINLYDAKTQQLTAQLYTTKLYEGAIKAMKSYSDNIEDDKEEEKEYVYRYPF